MKKSHIFLSTTLLFVLSIRLFAAQISVEKAMEKAQQFYFQNNASQLRSVPDFKLVYTGKDSVSLLRSANTPNYFYVFNVGSNDGFVLVSGDDATKSILGYSDEGTFCSENVPENLKNWLNFYQSEIKYAMESGLGPMPEAVAGIAGLRNATTVAPLLGKIKWNQGDPYNLICPKATGENRAVTGCTATAMAQIMRYYKWPEIGLSSHTYTSANYGSLTVNYAKTTYDWANMLETYGSTSTAIQDTAVATLMYHVGVSMDMNYSSTASAASVSNAGTAFYKYFRYDTDIQQRSRAFYSAAEWDSLVKVELNAARPILYSGNQGDNGGHAFVCDGYDTNNLYHINWGWGGMSDGYFELSSLQPSSAGIGGSTGGYSQGQLILTGIQKTDGVIRKTYEFGIWEKGLTPSRKTLTNINTSTFNMNFGFLNNGLNSFSGEVGLGLFKDGVFIKKLKTISTTLNSNYGFRDYAFSSISLTNTASGNYRIYCMYKSTSATTWSVVRNTWAKNNYADVVISGTDILSATIEVPSVVPSLALTQAIQPTGNVYKNKNAGFNITLKNSGTEFYSNLGIRLISKTDPAVSYTIGEGVVCIPSGETKSFSYSGKITCPTGEYFAVAIHDSTNTRSASNYKKVGPTDFGQIAVTVYPEPAAAVLSLTGKINLADVKVYRNGTISLNVPLKNTGGCFNSEVYAFVYPTSWSGTVGQLNTKTAIIETNETQTVTLTGSLDIAPGTYNFAVFINNGNWQQLTPNANSYLTFTLRAPITDLKDVNTPEMAIYPNPVRNELHINTSEYLKKAQITDLSGSILIQVQNPGTIQVGHLKSGVYLLKVETVEGSETLKFIKE